MHVSFGRDGYGDHGAEDMAAWKKRADALMVECLTSAGFDVVVDDYEADRTRVILDNEDVTDDWLQLMWDYACTNASTCPAPRPCPLAADALSLMANSRIPTWLHCCGEYRAALYDGIYSLAQNVLGRDSRSGQSCTRSWSPSQSLFRSCT